MTARSLELIASADLILHDRLIPAGALAGARDDAELIYVGKRPRRRLDPRRTGSTTDGRGAPGSGFVVRLKGGDPFVFGRGGEEAEALPAAGVPFEVVPGVTAGSPRRLTPGIPVTHRDDASAVAFVTGHEDPAKDETALDWEALARFPGTLVLYMGVKNLSEIAARSRPGATRPSRPRRSSAGRCRASAKSSRRSGRWPKPSPRRGSAPLGPDLRAGGRPPRRDRLARAAPPLHGKRVVVTRARAQASGLAATLTALGAEVVQLPAIRIEPTIESPAVRDAVEALHSYALVCLTSPNGARLLFEAMAAAGRDARALSQAQVAAIGPGTARRCASGA